MKAIILAAGVGSRMKKYTATLPKGMIEINNKTLIDEGHAYGYEGGTKKVFTS